MRPGSSSKQRAHVLGKKRGQGGDPFFLLFSRISFHFFVVVLLFAQCKQGDISSSHMMDFEVVEGYSDWLYCLLLLEGGGGNSQHFVVIKYTLEEGKGTGTDHSISNKGSILGKTGE